MPGDRVKPALKPTSTVKGPRPWVPTIVNNGHECVLARVSGVGDVPSDRFDPRFDRHIGQRNLHVAKHGTDELHLMGALGETKPRGTRLELLVTGPEARTAVDLLAPGLVINRRTRTHRIDTFADAPAPRRGEATVVRIQAVDPERPKDPPAGGYTIVLTQLREICQVVVSRLGFHG